MDMIQFTTGKYLDKTEVPSQGMNAKIDNIELQEIMPGENKPVLISSQLKKPMVLNKTNIKLLIAIFGTAHSNEWIGKPINIYNDPTVMYGGQIVGGLRVRQYVQSYGAPGAQPPGGGPAGAPGVDEDIPF